MTCDQLNEILVDYLYDELKPAKRKRLDQHLAGCASCAKLVTSHTRALKKTRASLAGPLDEEPPSRVRLRAIAVAREYAAANQKPRSLLARLLQIPWLLPTCGAAAVGILTFVIYVNKGSEPLPGQKPAPLDEARVAVPATPSPVPSNAEQPTPRPAPPTSAPPPAKEVPEEKSAQSASTTTTLGKRARGRAAHLSPKGEAARDELRGLRDKKAPLERRPAKKASVLPIDRFDFTGDDTPPTAGRASDNAAGPPVERLAEPEARKALPKSTLEDREFAQPPPARSAPGAGAPSAPPAASPPAPAAPVIMAPAPHALPPPPSPTKSRDEKAKKDTEQDYPLSAPMQEATADRDEERAPPAPRVDPALNAAITKADRLFAQKQWAAAAEAYRDLLRRYPSHALAPSWRGRLAQSLAGVAREQPAPSAPRP